MFIHKTDTKTVPFEPKLNELPKEIMEKALNLRNSVRTIYIALYASGKPSSSVEIALKVGHARAYVNMRLQQLADRNLVRVTVKGKTKFFEVIS